MALTIYAKVGLLRPRTCSRKAKATNFGPKAKDYYHCHMPIKDVRDAAEGDEDVGWVL